jgi:hypothetical protein
VGPEFLERSDPAAITHTLTVASPKDPRQKVVFGFNDRGGGYLWSARLFGFPDVPDGMETGQKGYGRGFLGAIRDQLHSGRYNPVQSGFNDLVGAPTLVLGLRDAVVVPQFQAPLYSDGSLGKERFHFEDGASEFDTSVITKDVSFACGLPAAVQKVYWVYAREPGAIGQFFAGKILHGPEKGKEVLNPKRRVLDISPTAPGDQTPRDVDMSFIGQVLIGVRPPGELFRFLHYRTGDRWVSQEIQAGTAAGDFPVRCGIAGIDGEFSVASTKRPINYNPAPNCSIDLPLFVLSTSGRTDRGTGIGVFVPRDDAWNARQAVVVDARNLTILGSEDRRLAGTLGVSKFVRTPSEDGGGFLLLQAIQYVSGLLSPPSAARVHGTNAMELLRQKAFVFFGTPEALLTASANQACIGAGSQAQQ